VIRTELEHHGVVGGDHGEAACDRQHAERDDKWRDTQIGNQHAVDCADQQRRCERGGDADLDAVAGMHHDREDHAAQAQDRTDRQIDATGDDHDRHSQRNDRDESEVAGDVEEIVRGRERIGGKRQENAGQDDRDRHPERLPRGQPGQQRKSRALDVVVELNVHQ